MFRFRRQVADVDEASASRAIGDVFVLSTLVAVGFGTLFYAFSVLITERAAGAEFSTSSLSVAYGGTVMVGGLLAYPIGRIADRRGVRLIVAVGSVLGLAGLGALSVAEEPWQAVLASWALIGPAGAMTFYEPAFVAVDQWVTADRRATALAILTVVGGLAGPVFLPVTAGLIEALGWRPAARGLGLILAVVGLAAAAVLPGRGSRGTRARSVPVPAGVMKERRFVLFSVSVVLGYGAMQAVFFHRIALFEAAGFSVTTVTAWAAISGLLSFPGRYAAPFFAARMDALRVNAAALFGLGIGVALMVAPRSSWQMGGHFVVFGLAFGVMLPLRAFVMSGWYSGPFYGRIMGAQWSAGALAGAAGPAVVGVLRDRLGGYSGAAALIVLMLLVAAVLAAVSERG